VPVGVLPPNAKAGMNLLDDDLVKGGAALQSYDVSECYAHCLAWNAAAVAWNAAAVWCPLLGSRGISLEKVSHRDIWIHHTKLGCFGRLALRATCCTQNFFKNLALFEKSTFLPILGRFCMRALWRRFGWKMPIFCPKSQFLAGSSHAAAIFSKSARD
jgi:hypothetical protein